MQTTNLKRRHLLATTAGSMVAAGLAPALAGAQTAATPANEATTAPVIKPLPAYVSWKKPDSMIVHTPTTIETKRSAFGTSVITPTDRLYIRNNLPAPDASIVADRNAWQVTIEGVVKPQTFSVADLKRMGLETIATVLQCSGNGRGYFAGKPSGTKWEVGAAGCVVWSGVSVRDLVAAVGGVAKGMAYMTGTGGETLPEGIDPKSVIVERSVPLSAMQDAMLAWEINGEPIPLAHGGPLRLIVPGYSGVNNIKYIKRLAFTTDQTQAAIQKTGYRLSPVGQKGDPSQPAVWAMDPKSWVNAPLASEGPIKAGTIQIQGVAMGGTQAVAKVDVSLDGGKSWKPARLVGPNLGKYAWRQFALATSLKPGTYDIACRTTDATGRVQVATSPENTGGYLNSGWIAHTVKITVV